jgi:hypothetical protein
MEITGDRVTGMATEKQLAANRANAQRSTGPRTAEGKAAVRLNALKHGLLAETMVLPNESQDEFLDLSQRVHNELSPQGEIEEFLATQVASYIWRLRRARRVEAGLFIRGYTEVTDQRPPRIAALRSLTWSS